ncbi:hypothetical protein GGR52DRAFT_570437 [Hypoxylon sp. FL1284]|nr:hypothetical protein GGR52DRAFT_570437 [Hypoxylon sp. FL1284]
MAAAEVKMAAAELAALSVRDDKAVFVRVVPGSSTSFVERELALTPLTPCIRIGRASKIPTKGFVAAGNNAWFDSPVMSRHHAEFVLDVSTVPSSVLIRDIGSLHGTFLKPISGNGEEVRLGQQQLVRLSSGDRLRFGTDIFRSNETFPPCVIDFVIMEREACTMPQPLMPLNFQSPNRVFRVYEDDEYDQDDDSVIETGMSVAPVRAIQPGPSIDLTRDDEGGQPSDANIHKHSENVAIPTTNSDVIDLTSESGGRLAQEPKATNHDDLEVTSSEPLSPERQPPPAPVASFAVCYIPSDAEDVPETESSNTTGNQCTIQQDLALADHADQHDKEVCWSDIERDTDSDSAIDGYFPDDTSDATGSDLAVVGMSPDDRYVSDNDDTSALDTVGDVGMSAKADADVDVDWMSTDSDVDAEDDVDYEVEDDVEVGVDEEDEDSVVSQSHEYAESDDGEDGEDGASACPPSPDEMLPSGGDTSSSSGDSTDSESSHSSPAPDYSNDILDALCAPHPPSGHHFTAMITEGLDRPASPTIPLSAVAARVPSPSDAAMFKSRPLPRDSVSSDARVRVLGTATGKMEYFEARECNRAAVAMECQRAAIAKERAAIARERAAIARECNPDAVAKERNLAAIAASLPPPVSAMRETLDGRFERSGLSVDGTERVNTPVDATNTVPESDGIAGLELKLPAVPDSTWSASGDRFINTHEDEDSLNMWLSRAQSPELDMTSAYQFQQSKMANEGGVVGQQPRRVGIEDLITQEPKNNRVEATASRLPSITVKSPEASVHPPNSQDAGQPSSVHRARGSKKRSFGNAFVDNSDVYGMWPEHDTQNSQDISSMNIVGRPISATVSELVWDSTIVDKAPEMPPVHVAPLPQAKQSPPVPVPAQDGNVQPSKRRRIAQAAAYVALGGAAAFTFMVSTAPVL